MAHRQLIDSLTSHISLYHSDSLPHSNSKSNSNSSPRSAILKWFSSLTVQQRLAHLTTVDSKFVEILLQMLGKVRARGHGFFIILPDLPSRDPPSLPTLCYRKSRGLLTRVAESNESERWIFECVRLFESRGGERIEDCSCSLKSLDTVTVTEEFVENMDRLVDAMDKISNGGFLRGENSDLGTDWVELEWLKSKGYYNLEAFVANRLEVSMRLAWLNCNSGRKRGVKLKEKLNAAAVAAHVYWRKKGCLDWWGNLDTATRKKILTTIMAKAAKHLTHEILKVANSAPPDEIWLYSAGVDQLPRYKYNYTVSAQRTMPTVLDVEFGTAVIPVTFCRKSAALVRAFNSLFVLRDVNMTIASCHNSEYDIQKLFYSSLGSVSTISDCVLRKVRGFLTVISLECTKLELLTGDLDKSSSVKPKEKLGNCSRKKKGQTRNTKRPKPNPVPKPCVNGICHENPVKDLDCAVDNMKKAEMVESKESPDVPMGKEISSGSPSSTLMEHTWGLDVGKLQTPPIRSQKEKNKIKRSVVDLDVGDSQQSIMDSTSSAVISESKVVIPDRLIDNSAIQNVRNDNSTDCNITPPAPALKLGGLFSDEDIRPLNSERVTESDEKSAFLGKPVRELHIKEFGLLKDQDRGCLFESRYSASSKCSPYEWPGVPSVYYPYINSHLPPATDRLHLDVGHHWHNHFCHSFVPTLHQARKSPIEGGCNQIFSCPVPMSLDWPPFLRGGVAPSSTSNYDSGFMSRRQSTFSKGLAAHNVQANATTLDDGSKFSGDLLDFPDLINTQDPADEYDNHWVSEEEYEVHAVSSIDYNQYFGGGIMYWNPTDHPGSGFSRPPSLSSDDSSWAWREADLNRAVDDMVTFSSSYSTNGLTSPTAASICSPFDTVGTGPQTVNYVMSGTEVTGRVLHSSSATDASADEDSSGPLDNNVPRDVEGKTGDSHPYPILRPIIIPNLSRDRSRSDIKRCPDHKSPHVPPTRREQPRIKRPPSPMVLSVPQAPRPPPPSPMSDSRKHRGFPTVRSGSSSPRHWGMRGWIQDGSNLDEACLRMDGAEVVWPWRSNNFSVRPMIQPLPAALLQDRLLAISQIARDQEHPDVSFPLQPPELQSCPARSESLSLMHNLLHNEIDSFCKLVAAENTDRKPYITWAVKRVTRSLQVLWPRSRTNIFGSNATGMSLPTSDVDIVVCLPPVRNLEPIKEAGILEGRNGIKETCLQHAARYLANQDWVKSDSLKTVENTAIPIIMLVVKVPDDVITSSTSVVLSPKEEPPCTADEQGNDVHSETILLEDSALPKCYQLNFDAAKDSRLVRLDISFKSPSHTGLQTTELVKKLTEQFPAATPLALVLKKFLADRSLDQCYSGGLSSYCLVLLIIRFLQHEHHLGRPINQNYGSLLMDFFYFFGNVFDPRHMRISVQGSGVYLKRERGCSIDPIHIDDPLFPTNNVGRNCFRIHQCIKAFSEAYSILENELAFLNGHGETCTRLPYRLLPKIIPSFDLL